MGDYQRPFQYDPLEEEYEIVLNKEKEADLRAKLEEYKQRMEDPERTDESRLLHAARIQILEQLLDTGDITFNSF